MIVSLTFDDGFADQLVLGPMLASRGMAGTFYVNSGRIGNPGWLTWDQLAELASLGNEIGGHTVDHLDLTTVAVEEATRQVCEDRELLAEHGFHAANFAYPYGESNAVVEQVVRDCGYRSGRRAWGLRSATNRKGPLAESVPPEDVYRIKTAHNPTKDTDRASLRRLVTQAEKRRGGWLILVFHHIGNSDDVYSTEETALVELLDWLRERGTTVKTIAEVIRGIS